MQSRTVYQQFIDKSISNFYSSDNTYIPEKSGDKLIDFCLYDCPHPDKKCKGNCPEFKELQKSLDAEHNKYNSVQGAKNIRRKNAL